MCKLTGGGDDDDDDDNGDGDGDAKKCNSIKKSERQRREEKVGQGLGVSRGRLFGFPNVFTINTFILRAAEEKEWE